MDHWDERYRSEDTPWCKGQPHPLLASLIERMLPQDFSGRIVVPGCGRGWDLVAIATARPEATIFGIDLSKTALEDAAGHTCDYPGIRLLLGDFLDPGWLFERVGLVDMVWEHTCFCAINPSKRRDYVESTSAILRPGAVLAGVFFLSLEDGGSGPPWNCPEHEMRTLFGNGYDVEQCTMASDTFEGRHGEEYVVVLRRHGDSSENP